MTTIVPEGEKTAQGGKLDRRGEEKAGTTKTRRQLMDEACLTFNLTPMEAEYLARSLKDIC